MTIEEVAESTFAFDTGLKKIGDCDREELLHIIGYQQETLLQTREVLHKQQALLGIRRH